MKEKEELSDKNKRKGIKPKNVNDKNWEKEVSDRFL